MEKKFKCKDEVIYRSKIEYGNHHWTYGIFSHYEHHQDVTFASLGFISLNINDWDILPYEGNEELVGTMDEPETEVKLEEGEWLMAKTDNSNWVLAQYKEHSELPWNNIDVVFSNGNQVGVDYVVRFSDFDPSNMEETKKHILCVKNGKIVKYKG